MTIERFARCARSRPAIVAAVTLWVLVPALAAPTPSAAASSRAQRQWLDPKAGWHGRRIMQPKREAAALAALPATLPSGWSAGPARPGTGFAHPRGSRRVSEVRRHRRGRGYERGQRAGRVGALC